MELHKPFLLLLITAVTCKKIHRKKFENKHALKEKLDFLRDDDISQQNMLLKNELLLDEFDSGKGGDVEDPCAKHQCGPGKQCDIDDRGKAKCACVKSCPRTQKRVVCSNHNETWDSVCDLYQMRCLCAEDSESCEKDKYKHVHMDYYGPCKDIGECSAEEMSDFPRRMREWLFNVMQELARRDGLSGEALRLEREAERLSDGRKWVNAVIWKFCDLDVHPHDRHVSRHELFPIRAPLMAMEHCVAPFLDSCDADADHRITLREWGNCLALHADEIQDKCAYMNRG